MSGMHVAHPTTAMGRQPLREELYVERLVASLAYHRTAEEAMTVTACREMQQLVATPERLFFLLNHPHFQSKGLVVLTSLLEDPLSPQAHAGISVLSDLASDTQGASALLNPKVMTMDPFAVVAMAYTAIGKLIIANTASDDHSVRACWDAAHVLHMLVPQPRGFTALQQLPLEEFRVVATALMEATQRRWPSQETGIKERSRGGASSGFFFSSTGEGLTGRGRGKGGGGRGLRESVSIPSTCISLLCSKHTRHPAKRESGSGTTRHHLRGASSIFFLPLPLRGSCFFYCFSK